MTNGVQRQKKTEDLRMRVATEVFVKSYADYATRTPEYLAEKAFEAADAFVAVAESRQQP